MNCCNALAKHCASKNILGKEFCLETLQMLDL